MGKANETKDNKLGAKLHRLMATNVFLKANQKLSMKAMKSNTGRPYWQPRPAPRPQPPTPPSKKDDDKDDDDGDNDDDKDDDDDDDDDKDDDDKDEDDDYGGDRDCSDLNRKCDPHGVFLNRLSKAERKQLKEVLATNKQKMNCQRRRWCWRKDANGLCPIKCRRALHLKYNGRRLSFSDLTVVEACEKAIECEVRIYLSIF